MRSFVQDPNVVASPDVAGAATNTMSPAQNSRTTSLVIPSRGAYAEGDVDKSDIKTPYLSCVQAVGPKSVMFTPGQIVLGETPLTTAPAPQQPTPKLRLLFVRVSKTFVENLPYNPTPGAPRPRVFGTLDQVREVGGVVEWRGNTPPSFIPKTTCLALIRCPAGFDDAQFNIIADDKTYAPAMVSFQKTSYPAAKTLWTDLSLSLKNNPHATHYDLFWNREPKGPNWVWVAKLVRVRDEQVSPALKTIAEKLGGANVSVDETDDAI